MAAATYSVCAAGGTWAEAAAACREMEQELLDDWNALTSEH